MAQSPEKRKTIGYLSPSIDNQNNKNRFLGIVDQARQEDCDLFCFLTRYFDDPMEYFRYSNILIDFAVHKDLDGIVIGNIIREDITGPDDIKQFFNHFPMPVVTIRENTTGIPFCPTDNYSGMKDVVRHMVTVHGCKKLCFVSGPERHPYAEQRLAAFRDSLCELGLAATESLISPPNTWWKSKFDVILNDRGLRPGFDFDGVICASDLAAIECINLLRERGIMVPRDMPVFGFDDLVEGAVFTPPISSVSMPFYEQGQRTCELLIQNQSQGCQLTTKLVIKDSCGCLDLSRMNLDPSLGNRMPFLSYDEIRNTTTRILSDTGQSEEVCNELSTAIAEQILKGRGTATSLFYQLLVDAASKSTSISSWRQVIDEIRNALTGRLDRDEMIRAENLFHQMRSLVFTTWGRVLLASQLEQVKWNDLIRKIGMALHSTFNINAMCDELAKWLPVLKISSCYISLYDDPRSPLSGAWLVFAYREGLRATEQPHYKTAEIIPPDFLPAKRPFCLLVESLHFRDRQIGILCYEFSGRDTLVYEMLKYQIDNTLQITLSIQELEEARQEVDAHARELARSNVELEQFAYAASHDLQEPLRKIITMSDRIMGMQSQFQNETMSEYLKRMHKAAYRMHNLITDLLKYSRVARSPRPFERIRLEEICHQVISDLEEAIRQTRGKVICTDSAEIEAEPVLIHQLFQNLIGNALKFNREGVPPLVTIRFAVHDKRCEIRISDNGIGIAEEFHDRIFGLFERLHPISAYEGSGIGLSICKKIVDFSNGKITLESTPGQGTTFIINLPLKRQLN